VPPRFPGYPHPTKEPLLAIEPVVHAPARPWLPPLILALGLVVAASIMGDAVRDFRMADRFVEVKGLAEREVMADLAIWPVSYMVSANTLEELSRELERNDQAVLAYLESHGFQAGGISRNPPRITDQWSQAYGSQRPETRFMAERTLTLRTDRVAETRQALQEVTRLLEDGVVLAPSWGATVQFLFTGLEALKPGMIAQATADARRAATQFAEDSGSEVGHIRTARQGFFSISELDPSMPELKTVRVVTTVEYFLDR
jgi:uncharacterized protein